MVAGQSAEGEVVGVVILELLPRMKTWRAWIVPQQLLRIILAAGVAPVPKKLATASCCPAVSGVERILEIFTPVKETEESPVLDWRRESVVEDPRRLSPAVYGRLEDLSVTKIAGVV